MSQRQEAFQEILPTLPAKRAAVLSAISSQGEHGATLDELVGILNWRINRISGRVSELQKSGYLTECGTRGRQTVWAACLPQDHAAPAPKAKPIKARILQVADMGLFGHYNFTVTIPYEARTAHIKPGAHITIKF